LVVQQAAYLHQRNGMRFATYEQNGDQHVGMVSVDGKNLVRLDLPAAEAARGVLAVVELASRGGGGVEALLGQSVPIGDVRLKAPVPRPRRNIFCVGRNYHAHAQELRSEEHTSELQSRENLVCRLLLEKK